MHAETERLVRDLGSELVLGIVAPVGADLDLFVGALSDHVRQYRYTPRVIRLSELLGRVREMTASAEFDRRYTQMSVGNELRQRTKANEILALWAVAEIFEARRQAGRLPSTAWIIRSIKHPDEVRALRAVYGPGFFLIGLSVPEVQRRRYLRQKGMSDSQVDTLIERDRAELDTAGFEVGHGQGGRDAHA